MAGTQRGPLPSRLTLLADLPTLPPAAKVRVLGCVTGYSTKKAVLTLEHNHPAGNGIKALVDVELLLNMLKSNETQVGEWVNVIGYTVASIENNALMKDSAETTHNVRIQALVLWSAGPLKLSGYERSLDQLKYEEAVHRTTD